MATELCERLSEPVDGASVRAFRALFGALMFVATIRFWARGWISTLWLEPPLHFHYYGFSFIEPLPGVGMYVLFALLSAAALGIATGTLYRTSCGVFFLGFTYAELCEKSAFLNHYYLVSLLSFLLCFMPATAKVVPRWTLLVLRAQLALVYFFAGVAKLEADWLLHAQPLRLWLAARSDVPLFGSVLARTETAYAAAWLGAIFDLSAPFLLWWPRSRGIFYVLVVGFHVFTALLFPIGVFPWLMIAATTIFFAPDWPAKLLSRWRTAPGPEPTRQRISRAGLACLAVYFALQIALPLRHFAYPGPAGWTEEGSRFAWRVMLTDKVGSVRFQVVDREHTGRWSVSPSEYLTPFQERMMAQSPDMILELSHVIARDFAKRGFDVAVHADAWAALNGRRARRLVNPLVDLARENDSLLAARFIEPWREP